MRTDPFTLTDEDFKQVMATIDDHIHDFYFAFYPKTMAMETPAGLRLEPTRLGFPKSNDRRFTKRARRATGVCHD